MCSAILLYWRNSLGVSLGSDCSLGETVSFAGHDESCDMDAIAPCCNGARKLIVVVKDRPANAFTGKRGSTRRADRRILKCFIQLSASNRKHVDM